MSFLISNNITSNLPTLNKDKVMKTYTEVIEFCKSNLMFLAMLAFVLVATTAFTFVKTDIPEKIVRPQQVSKVYTSMPVLSDTSTFPTLSAQAAFVVDLDSGERLAVNQEGMICVRGKSIFGGYWDRDQKSPFVMVEGKEYYETGDLGRVDEEGNLFLTGRLKRFLKI